ncbi:MAG: hypothetical protein U5M50_00460 [Sphingobium sp.]|nr:hypothetical protein [Sphingobium sp.]
MGYTLAFTEEFILFGGLSAFLAGVGPSSFHAASQATQCEIIYFAYQMMFL